MSARRFEGVASISVPPKGTLVAIGNFDGVHRGHQAVLGAALAEATESGLLPLVLTFHPHPSVVLGRGARPLLTTVERKIELVGRVGSSVGVVVEPFTLELARKQPRGFVVELLCDALGAKVVIVGQNFRFGHKRAGDLTALQTLGVELGFVARAESLCGDDDGAFSSSRIRELVSSGSIEKAASLLGRPHSVAGTVIEGDKRGRTIGFPTANLGDVEEALPAHGVYACLVDRVGADGASALATGVVNVGVRPTVAAGHSVEAHLFDFEEDLYGQRLRVHFVSRLRGEVKFPGLEELRAQIARDAEAARRILESLVRDPAAAGAWH